MGRFWDTASIIEHATTVKQLSRLAVGIAALIALAVAVSGPGYRFGWWPLGVAFGTLRTGGYLALALAIAAIAFAVLLRRRRAATRGDELRLGIAAVLSIGIAAFPLRLTWTASRVPPIHDITTDTANPPAFVAIAPLRAGARNPVAYGGEAVAAQQRNAYPDIKPLSLVVTPPVAFERALRTARAFDWTIVHADAEEGRIEASDRTPFFGFIDDVVIRITADGAGSRVDVRSKSRIGRSDMGANARRIRAYLAKLAAAD